MIFPYASRDLTRHAMLRSQFFDATKWSTVLVPKIKGKPCSFDVLLCGSLHSTFKLSFLALCIL